MFRRDAREVLDTEWDHRVVKWSLIAAAFALVIGCYAELESTTVDAASATAVQVIETPAPRVTAAS